MGKFRFREFVIDPSSGQPSASRLLLMVLILVYLPVLVALDACGRKLGVWTHFAMIVSAVAGVYGVNTAGRVWRSSPVQEPYTPPGDPPPKAKPAPPQEVV